MSFELQAEEDMEESKLRQRLKSDGSSSRSWESGGEEDGDKLQSDVLAKVSWRLLPIYFSIALMCYIDRTNLAFAADSLKEDLGFTDSQYGLGASVFFFSYATCGVPGTLFVKKVGAPMGLMILLLGWAAASISMAFVNGLSSFIIARILLGAAEAGTFPSMLYHLSTFYSSDSIGTNYTRSVCAATAISGVVGGPLAALILANTDGWLGMEDWRWLFIIEGLPTLFLALVVYFLLPRSPAECKFLSERERNCLVEKQRHAQEEKAEGVAKSSWEAIKDARILMLSASMFLWDVGYYGVIFWLPLVLKGGEDGNRSAATIALLTAIPYSIGALVMIAWARHSDRTQERLWHTALADFCAGLGLAVTAVLLGTVGAQATVPMLFSLSVAVAGVWSMYGPFFGAAAEYMAEDAAAAGFSFINSAGSFGGLAGPYVVGLVKQLTRTFTIPMAFLAGAEFLSGVVVLMIRHVRPRATVYVERIEDDEHESSPLMEA